MTIRRSLPSITAYFILVLLGLFFLVPLLWPGELWSVGLLRDAVRTACCGALHAGVALLCAWGQRGLKG